MYRLMIVEDEQIVLEGMIKIIDFKALGFEVVCACSNGLEALEKFDEVKPDVVITDICMEIMDGLEFIEEVNKRNHNTKFVIVSGYQEYKFLRKALNLKVMDYILKPVTAKEFREILNKVAMDLEEIKRDDIEKNRELCDEQSSFLLQRNLFLNRLVSMTLSEEEIDSNLKKYNIVPFNKYFQVLIYKMNNISLAKVKLNYDSTYSLISEFHEKIRIAYMKLKEVLVFGNTNGSVTVIINTNDKVSSFQENKSIAKRLYEESPPLECAKVCCYVGEYVDCISSVIRSYNSANKLIINGVLKNGVGYYDSSNMSMKKKLKNYNPEEDIRLWVNDIVFAKEDSYTSLERIVQTIRESGFWLSDYRFVANQMVKALLKAFKMFNEPVPFEVVDFELRTEEEITLHLREITAEGIETFNLGSREKEGYIASKVIEYISEEYVDSTLDLNLICDHFNISKSYFSTLFKKETGETFIKYLNNYRIEKAKELLVGTQKNISEISELVGYSDPHYFGIVFKKTVNSTPKEFREKAREAYEEV